MPSKRMDENKVESLKYLQFVYAMAIYAILCISKVYTYAKDKSGILKPRIEAIENTVKTVVGPVYDKYHDVPIEVLKFLDSKMDESINGLDLHVPQVVREVSTKAYSTAQRAHEVARIVIWGVQRTGAVNVASGIATIIYSKYEPTAKELRSKYELLAVQYAVSAWGFLNRLPLFPQVAQVMVPTAAYCSKKYNVAVLSTAENGYKAASFLPLVPIAKIANVLHTSGDFQPLDSHHRD